MTITNKGLGLFAMTVITVFIWWFILSDPILAKQNWNWYDYAFSWMAFITIIGWIIIIISSLTDGFDWELDLTAPFTRFADWIGGLFVWEYRDKQRKLIEEVMQAKDTDEINLIVQKLEVLDETRSKLLSNKFRWRLPDEPKKLELKEIVELKKDA